MSKPLARNPFIRSFRGCVTVVVIILAAAYLLFRIAWPFFRDHPPPPRVERNHPSPRNPGTDLDAGTVAAYTAIHLALGNPSNAATRTDQPDNYLLVNQSYALSYNRSRGTPNWVSWRVMKTDLGDVRRTDDFRPDDRLPANWNPILPTDYTRSGFTRGHMCPAGDRTASPEMNSTTFVMTNIVPQTDDSNQGVWLTLEEYLRHLVWRGATVYTIAGAYGDQQRIRNRVTAPTNIWKVAVILPQGGEFKGALPADTYVIAIDTPNIDGVRDQDWRQFRTTVRAIERATGLDLLSNLPRDQQVKLENSLNNN